MHMTTIALILAILGLVASLFLLGGAICMVTLGYGIYLFVKDKSIEALRIIAISAAGVILPIIMYLNTYGFHLPYDDGSGRSAYKTILATNYENLGIDLFGKEKSIEVVSEELAAMEDDDLAAETVDNSTNVSSLT